MSSVNDPLCLPVDSPAKGSVAKGAETASVLDHTGQSGRSPMLRPARAQRMSVVGQSEKGVVVSAVQEIRDAPVIGQTPISAEVREAALDRAVAKLAAEGWELETKPDVEQVLVGHDRFRRILVRRQWSIRNLRELVEVDKRGTVSTRRV